MSLSPRLILLFLLLLCISPATAGETNPAPPAKVAVVQVEIEAILSRTFDVMALTRVELQQLIADCDRVAPQLSALPESPRKVYRRRLEMARNLFVFTLDNRKPEEP